MKKIIIVPILMIVMMNIAFALTLSGTINYVPSLSNTTYTHYGISSGIEQITVDPTEVIFNAYSKNNITLTANNHGTDNVYFNYNTSTKKLYINITHATASVNVSGLEAIYDNTLKTFDVKKSGYIVDSQSSDYDDYVITGIGEYVFQPTSTLTSFGVYTSVHDTDTYETERVSWNLTIADSIGEQLYEVILYDDYSNEYNTTYEIVGNNRIYTAEFNIPKEPTADTNVGFWWKGNLYAGGSISTSHFNSSVTMIDLYNYMSTSSCPGGYAVKYDWAFRDEDNPTIGVNITTPVQLEVEYWYGDNGGQLVISENYETDFYAGWRFWLCARNSSLDYHANVYMKYDVPAPQTIDPESPPLVTTVQTCDGSNCTSNTTTEYIFAENTFTERWYSFDLSSGSGQILEYPYSIVNSSYYVAREVILLSSVTGEKLEDVYVSMERYYLDEGLWRIVQIDKTDADGKGLFYIKDKNTDYRFIFYDTEGNSYQTTPTMHFDCPTQFCTTTFYTDPTGVDVTVRPDIQTSITYNNVTGIIKLIWNSVDDRQIATNFKVIKATNTGDLLICDETVTDLSDVYYCDVTSHRGMITTILTSTFNGVIYTEDLQKFDLRNSKLHTVVDFGESIIWSFIILLVIILASIYHPVGALVSMMIGLIFLSFLGLLSGVSSAFIIIAGILVTIVSFKVKT